MTKPEPEQHLQMVDGQWYLGLCPHCKGLHRVTAAEVGIAKLLEDTLTLDIPVHLRVEPCEQYIEVTIVRTKL